MAIALLAKPLAMLILSPSNTLLFEGSRCGEIVYLWACLTELATRPVRLIYWAFTVLNWTLYYHGPTVFRVQLTAHHPEFSAALT
jgi:hypothetical protein